MKKANYIIIIFLSLLPIINYAQTDTTIKSSNTTNKLLEFSKLYYNFQGGALVSGNAYELGENINFIFSNKWGFSLTTTLYNFNNVLNMPWDYNQHVDKLKYLFAFDHNPNDAIYIFSIRLIKEFQISKSFFYSFEAGLSSVKFTESTFYTYGYVSPTNFYYDYFDQQTTVAGLSLQANVDLQLTGFLGLGVDFKSEINKLHSFVAADVHLTFWLYNKERRAAKRLAKSNTK